MKQKLNSLEDFVQLIKERPAMYLGGRTITHLKAFIDGWFFGIMEEIDDHELLNSFQDWLQKKYKIDSNQSWAQIILFYSMDEYSALDHFFKLFSDFLKDNHAKAH